MKALTLATVIGACLGSQLQAAPLAIHAAHSLAEARENEVLIVPWSEVAAAFPDAKPDKLQIRDASGKVLPYQFTNFNPGDKKGRYDDVIFQHSFAAGENAADFTLETVPDPVLPFAPKVFCRYVPERFDDFAWENDRVAHRIYGRGLDTEAAGKSRMISSGLDVWTKRVSYPIVDRWYLRGHDNYHVDNGEGLDFYSVNTGRGCGGTGIWDGSKLHVSKNWSTWRVVANGPLRAIFELTYEPWDAGNGVLVTETKRFTIDAGRNLDEVQSTFTFSGPEELTVAVGVGKHDKAKGIVGKDISAGWLSLWEVYPKEVEASLGTGILVPTTTGAAEDELNHLLLARVKSGVPVTYFLGAGWTRAGLFKDQAQWEAYLGLFSRRLASPVKVTCTKIP